MPIEPLTPDVDQAAAAYRDLTRLRELMLPYVTSTSEDFSTALPRMPADQRAEAEALIARTAAEDPDTAAARREHLLRLASLEATARETVARATSPVIRRRAARMLAKLEQSRDRAAGLPPASSPGESEDSEP